MNSPETPNPIPDPENEFKHEVQNGYGEIPESVRYGLEELDPDIESTTPSEEIRHFDQDLGEVKQLEGQQMRVEGLGWCHIALVDPESGGVRVLELENQRYSDLDISDFQSRL